MSKSWELVLRSYVVSARSNPNKGYVEEVNLGVCHDYS